MKIADLLEAENNNNDTKPVELKDVTKFFPKGHKKAVSSLLSKGRLVWNGKVVIAEDGSYGPALEQAHTKAESFLKKEKLEIEIDTDDDVLVIEDKPAEVQEVYAGYSKSDDTLLIGFDVWMDEEVFNQDWDDHFEKVQGETFDMENSSHEKQFKRAFKEWQDKSFRGVLVSVTSSGKCSIVIDSAKGFYAGVYRSNSFKSLDAIDFRLD